MSTEPPSHPLRGASDTSPLPAPARRGATQIPDTVVARIAARAAREALSRRGDGSPPRPGLGAPRATATVHNGSARLGVSLGLPYPVDIAGTCGEIRHYVADRVSYLTGMRVDTITVSVRRLVPDVSPRRGRVR
ncbi:Asp23/Gls24 family envelope stress response protein [Streptomyces botrytidirepellens]|uniref:Asp23/Gls24 family envelope stress response protein n=1 Tax=Streptomyces botrytidirepellens TaxID=2486417 RepID=UPI001FE3B956|nr:Asp23/Gls24 family envelope stress response protein [Streptomyces botrytidirepellens]